MNADLRRLSPREYVTSRWSGGATTQLAIAPPGAEYARRDFLWRISSATVELEASDFTPLPDYERFLSTLEGEIRVSHDGGPAVALAPGRIHRFDGGAATRSEGTCVDFNLMLRKGACAGELRYVRLAEGGSLRLCRTLEGRPGASHTLVVYCAEGDGFLSAEGRSVPLARGEAAVAENGEPLLRCRSASAFLICEITAEPAWPERKTT